MGAVHEYDRFRTGVRPALISKIEEFRLLGYGAVTEQELWTFLTKKKWKKVNNEIRLFEIVGDILAVKVSEYMTFATVEAYKGSGFSFGNEDDRKEMLK